MHGEGGAASAFAMDAVENEFRLAPQGLTIEHGYIALSICHEENCARLVPNEALYFILVLDLLYHAPHTSIVEVNLLEVVAGSEKVFCAHSLAWAKNTPDDLFFGALNMHGVPRLARVPDAEREILRG